MPWGLLAKVLLMKKQLFLFVCFFASMFSFTNAQTLHINILDEFEQGSTNYFCADTVVLHGDTTCSCVNWLTEDWSVIYECVFDITFVKGEYSEDLWWTYDDACNFGATGLWFRIHLSPTAEPLRAPFEETVECGSGQVEIYAYEGEEIEGLSVQWNDGDTSFSRFVGDGEWTATVSDTCGRQVTNTWFVGDWTGTHETVSSATSIFPNPAHGAFTVRGEGTLVIFNSIGQKVRESKIDNETIIDGLPAGMYFLQVNGSVKKVVVE